MNELINKAHPIAIVYFVLVMLLGTVNTELRMTESYLYILVLSIVNLIIWVYLKTNKK
jgi:hypothetical protein